MSPTMQAALISIDPHQASSILDGRTTIEYRKESLLPDVVRVLMYATSPKSVIVGEFSVCSLVSGPPEQLWGTYHQLSTITKYAYTKYYQHTAEATGILIKDPVKYVQPIRLNVLEIQSPPYSYHYLDPTVVDAHLHEQP